MKYGYQDQQLRIDLTHQNIVREPLPNDLVEQYIGGRGFVAKILFDEIKPGSDPLGPDNLFVIATGPLTAHFLPSSGKTHFGAKSPATGGYGDSNMGGHFGPALKYSGYDLIILKGCALEPSYLYIDDDTVEIRPAADYWGMGALSVEKKLKDDLGEEFQIITIGPAGENKVHYACISHDFGRQAGRTGIGAVMGSKNIKAIAVRGTGHIPVQDPQKAYAEGKKAYQEIRTKPGFTGWTPEGTAGITDWVNEVGTFPTRNFQTSFAEHYKEINGEAILKNLKITDKGCYCCPTPCGKYGHAKTKLGEVFVEGPEFETIALFGGNCLLQTIEEVAYANYLCDEWGLDTISTGAVVSWAIECFEKGFLSKDEIGRDIQFKDLETIEYLAGLIARREGIGDLLADGVRVAASKVKQGSDQFAIHVKGLEWTGYECRNAPSMMLAYLTADIGAHHNRAWVLGHDMAGSWSNVHDLISSGGSGKPMPEAIVKPECADYVIESQHIRPVFDFLGTCRLQLMELGFEGDHYSTLYQAITGRELSWPKMLAISEKIWHLTRSFSVREVPGFGRHLEYPPKRFMDEPTPSGPNEGHCLPKEKIDQLLDWYYEARGWDQNGIPTRETLINQGLTEVMENLEAQGHSLTE